MSMCVDLYMPTNLCIKNIRIRREKLKLMKNIDNNSNIEANYGSPDDCSGGGILQQIS